MDHLGHDIFTAPGIRILSFNAQHLRSIRWLIAFRFLQAVGGSAGPVIGRTT